jgi:hypothetical protein
MINPTSSIYMHTVNRACTYAAMGTFTTATLPTYVPLPTCVTTMSCSVWVDVNIWRTGTGAEIARSVFLRVGNRPPVVPVLHDDDSLPTRGIFLTLSRDKRYTDMTWPAGIPPLVFYSVRSVQQVNHVHLAMVFNYFSKSPGHLCDALGLRGASCFRIKTSWEKVMRYMRDQACGILSYVVNRQEALAFRDYHRMSSPQEAVLMESATLGSPFVIDGHTPRTKEWRWQGVHGHTCNVADIQHVDIREVHVSGTPGRVDGDYKGEAVVFAPLADDVILPTRVTFAVSYKR